MNKFDNINEMLLDKLQREYDNFILELEKLEPAEIINKAYEKVMKEDIVLSVEIMNIDYEDAITLYSLEAPLASLYSNWLNTDYSYMELLKESIGEYISKIDSEKISSVDWYIKDSTLFITGKGELLNFKWGDSKKWRGEKFTKVVIGEGVHYIGRYAFEGCVSLESITIPESVQEIGYSAFWGCNNIIISTPKDSTAHRYAVDNDIKVNLIDALKKETKKNKGYER